MMMKIFYKLHKEIKGTAYTCVKLVCNEAKHKLKSKFNVLSGVLYFLSTLFFVYKYIKRKLNKEVK